VVCDFLFAPDALTDPDFDPSDAVDFWDLVNRQDWRIGESVQRGMSSFAAERGWFAPMEDDSADIAQWYRGLMGDERTSGLGDGDA
jgi:Rieske 2Fe-2S family protein